MHNAPDQIVPPALSAELADRLLVTAIAHGERTRLQRRSSAMALTLLFIAAAGLGLGERSAPPDAVVLAAVGDARVVRLVYESRADRDDAQVSVTLPQNLRVAGHPGTRDLTWSTSLRKGKNLLELPVVLTDASDAPLKVAFASANGVKEVRLLIRANTSAPIDASVQPLSARRIS